LFDSTIVPDFSPLFALRKAMATAAPGSRDYLANTPMNHIRQFCHFAFSHIRGLARRPQSQKIAQDIRQHSSIAE
jgi:hypothetical protein